VKAIEMSEIFKLREKLLLAGETVVIVISKRKVD
jgi:hypothetical protein